MDFLSYKPMEPGLYFDLYNNLARGVLLLLALCIIFFRKKIAASDSEKSIRIFVTLLVISVEFTGHLAALLDVSLQYFIWCIIPFELCACALWMSVALCLSSQKNLFEYLYFWGMGAVAALIFINSGGSGPDRIRFYQYFFSHGYIVLTIIYFIAVKGYTVSFWGYVRSIGLLLVVGCLIRLFNMRFAAPPFEFNYMFTLRPPPISSPLDAFGSGWGYFFMYMLLTIVVLSLTYLPWPLVALISKHTRGTIKAERLGYFKK